MSESASARFGTDNGLDDAQLNLIQEFRRRFPLLERIEGTFGRESPAERIPWFFGFLLAASARQTPGACCFVLDKTEGTTVVAAVLAALTRLQREFPRLVEHYARTALSPGQRVKVRPTNLVFEYQGLWDGQPGFFRLKMLDEKSWRSVPLRDVLRLEPTDRERPRGTGRSNLGEFERGALDYLLDIAGYGNNSLVENSVLVLMPRAQFGRVIESVTLSTRHSESTERLSELLPWGSIDREGILIPQDSHQVVGEPLVAATGEPHDLALAAKSADKGTKVVFVDGARKLVQDLQAFDDIVGRQPTVILASPGERKELEVLRDRECQVWRMSSREVLLGETNVGARARTSILGATVRSASIRHRSRIIAVDCWDEAIEAAAASLDRVAQALDRREETHEADQLSVKLYRILFECSECCLGDNKELSGDLQSAGQYLASHERWLDPSVAQELKNAMGALGRAIATAGCGHQKADALLKILTEQEGRWAVAVRSPRSAEKLRNELDALGAAHPVIPLAVLNPKEEFDGIILPTWPNEQRFTHLRNMTVTPDIRILTYPFENRWISRYQLRDEEDLRSNPLGAEDRSSILGIETGLLSWLYKSNAHSEAPPRKEISLDLPVFRLEERVLQRAASRAPVAIHGEEVRKALMVKFLGGCYALLTEWADVPRLNELINSIEADDGKYRLVAASDLSLGDFLLFRASGDKELVRLIAEEIVGLDDYGRIRDTAESWKSCLRKLGETPADVQRCLQAQGLFRNLATVTGWLNNPDRIGPGYLNDIDVIAVASADSSLLPKKEAVKQAISKIRSTHIIAGRQLTKLILSELNSKRHHLGNQPLLLDFEYGQAWIVQVEEIDEKWKEYPTTQVNRLLWEVDSTF